MSGKFIPSGDSDFLTKCGNWARTIGKCPERFAISREDADALMQAFESYQTAFQQARRGSQSRASTTVKDSARKLAEGQMQRCRHLILANQSLSSSDLLALEMEPSASGRKRQCPQEPPELHFVRALHEGSAAIPMHELKFHGINSRNKPAGATRLELFVELVGPDEPVPCQPGELHGGRAWYLRSFTRSPIKLHPPMASVPMLVVYWARWADSTGNVGPFCKTVPARVEGWMSNVPSVIGLGTNGKVTKQIASVNPQPKHRAEKYSIAVIEAQTTANNPQSIEPTPTRQLEDQSEREAA